MKAEDEEALEKPGRREQRETWPRSRAEGLECRAEEEPAFPACRITCDPPQALCHLPAAHMEPLGLRGWLGQLRHLKTFFLGAVRAFPRPLQARPSLAMVQEPELAQRDSLIGCWERVFGGRERKPEKTQARAMASHRAHHPRKRQEAVLSRGYGESSGVRQTQAQCCLHHS